MNEIHKIIGTAGHIDHGKSALVKAMTGQDPDRFKEEKERGITIDLGFAFLNEKIAFIDVPGHERFIKNMVAGVTGIHAAMLVIAADDGIMPQTREHLEILEMLGLNSGLIALTKTDLAENEWMELVESDIKEFVKGTFLEDSPVIRTSIVTGTGLEELKKVIVCLSEKLKIPGTGKPFRMPVDRAFSIHGFGTVVTGAVKDGKVQTDGFVELLPEKKTLKIRRLEAHGEKVDTVFAGDRAAVNLSGTGKEVISRGDMLAEPDCFRPVYMVDAFISAAKSNSKPLKNHQKVKFHNHTSEMMGKINLLEGDFIPPGENAMAQIRLERPVVNVFGDRFILRLFSPQITVAGGRILHPFPRKHRGDFKKTVSYLEKLKTENITECLETVLEMEGPFGMSSRDLEQFFGNYYKNFEKEISQLEEQKLVESFKSGKELTWMHKEGILKIRNDILDFLTEFHQNYPKRTGFPSGEMIKHFQKKYREEVLKAIITKLVEEKKISGESGFLKLSTFKFELSSSQLNIKDKIESYVKSRELSPPKIMEIAESLNTEENEVSFIVTVLRINNVIHVIDGQFIIHNNVLDKMEKDLVEYLKKNNHITVAQFRDFFKTSRKFAVPILEYFDRKKITRREEDIRVLDIN